VKELRYVAAIGGAEMPRPPPKAKRQPKKKKSIKKKPKWVPKGTTAGRISVRGQTASVRVQRPSINVTVEQGFRVRSRKVRPKGMKKTIVIQRKTASGKKMGREHA
jgi:hypothetical protein